MNYTLHLENGNYPTEDIKTACPKTCLALVSRRPGSFDDHKSISGVKVTGYKYYHRQ
jgi:hypothetical protein